MCRVVVTTCNNCCNRTKSTSFSTIFIRGFRLFLTVNSVSVREQHKPVVVAEDTDYPMFCLRKELNFQAERSLRVSQPACRLVLSFRELLPNTREVLNRINMKQKERNK